MVAVVSWDARQGCTSLKGESGHNRSAESTATCNRQNEGVKSTLLTSSKGIDRTSRKVSRVGGAREEDQTVEVQSKFKFRRRRSGAAWASAPAPRFKLAANTRRRGQCRNEYCQRDCDSNTSSKSATARRQRHASTSVSSKVWNEY